MNYTKLDITKLLRANPDLQVDSDYMMPVNSLDGRPYAAVNLPFRSEHEFQVALIAECDRRALTNPLWGLIFHIPNGGKRSKAQGGKLKAAGVRAGVPDLFIVVARRGYHGLFIELKIEGNSVSEPQKAWILRLQGQGYLCHTIYEFKTAIWVLEWYLEGK